MRQAAAAWKASALLTVLLAVSTSAVAGLGLGEARVDSFLGQNLEARITLLQPSQSALESLEVSVASTEDHARLGVPTEALALGLDLVLDDSVDPPILRLRSRRPANDPFLQVLVNVRWSSGRMLREYTLFLDPPAVPVAPTVRRREEAAPEAPPEAAPETAERPAAAPEPAPTARTEPEPSAPVPDDEVVVQRGQTLWAIASNWRPDPSLTMNQAMVAIFERNPEAFINNNVNRLRQGARLSMPEAAAARNIPAAEATRRMQEQTEAWQAGTDPRPAAPDPQPEPVPEPVEPAEPEAAETEPVDPVPVEDEAPAETEAAEPVVEAAAEPRLELVPPDEDIVAEAAALGAERERLSRRLDSLEAEAASEGLESPEIATLADSIRQAIDSADAGGLLVASEDLAVFEQQLREARLAREAEQPPVQEPEPAPATEPAPRAPAATPDGFLDRWLWPLVGGAAGLVLLMVLLALRRRWASQAAETEPEPVPAQQPSAPATVAPAPLPEQPAAEEDVPTDDALPRAEESAGQKDRGQDGDAALAGILGRSDAPEPSPIPEQAEDNDRAVADDEAQDLAELSNRLDPGEGERQKTADDELTLEDEDLDALFAEPEEPAGQPASEAAEDHEPLTLDFDLPEFEPEPAPEPEPDKGSVESGGADSDADPALPDFTVQPSPGDFTREDAEISEPESSDDMASEDPLATLLDDDDTPETDDRVQSGLSIEQTDEVSGDKAFEADDDSDDDGTLEDFVSALDEESPDEVPDSEVPADTNSPWLDLDETPAAEQAGADEDEQAPSDTESGVPDAQLSDEDAEVKLDLARAYLSMEDPESARVLLEEIMTDGSDAQREQAQKLIDQLP